MAEKIDVASQKMVLKVSSMYRGDAKTWYSNASVMNLTKYANGETSSKPQVGDILVSESNDYGHIAIVRNVTDSSVYSVQQNFSNTTTDVNRYHSLTYSGGKYTIGGFSSGYPIRGWLRRQSYPGDSGYASVSSSSVTPSSVVLGQNFQVSVTLKEINGYPKTFDKVAFAILNPDGSFAFDFAMYDNVSIPAYGTWSQTATNYIYSSRPPGTYQLMVRGNIGGGADDWFDFDSTGTGGNPIYFDAYTEGSDPPDDPIDPGTGDADIAIRTVEISEAGDDDFHSELNLTLGDFSKIDMEVKVENKKSEDVYVDIYYYWDDDRDPFSYASDHLVGTDMDVKIEGNDTVTEHKRGIQIPTQPGKYYYYINVIAPGDDDDSSESDHDQYGKITISAPTFPDLVIPTIGVNDSTLSFSQPFTINATVKNQGNGVSAATTLRYYLSTDATITSGDTALGIDAIPSLAVTGTSSQDFNATAPGSEGVYWIGACVDAVSGELNVGNNCSSGVIIDIRKPIPAAPSSLRIDAASLNSISLSWNDNSNNEEGFQIERSTDMANWVAIATLSANTTSYQDTGLSANSGYYYRIRAYNSGGLSIWSNEVYGETSSALPIIPSTPSATDGTYTDRVRISWSLVAGATSYQIYRCTSSLTTSCGSSFTSTSSPYDDTGAVAGTTYYYRVKACNGSGCSGFSDYDTGYRSTPLNNYTLTTALVGSGTITSNPQGINCGSDCIETYAEGTSVTLSPIPDNGWIFTGWEGSCSGTAPCVLSMNDDRHVTAHFSQISQPDQYEPDNSSGQAKFIQNDNSQAHSIFPADDVDWVKFNLNSKADLTVQTVGSSGDTRIWLYNNALEEIAFDDDDGDNLFSKIYRKDLAPGTYYAKVDEFNNNDYIPSYMLTVSFISAQDDNILLMIPAILAAAKNSQTKKPGSTCAPDMIFDCNLNCVDGTVANGWIGDGFCDDGEYGIFLNCPAFNNDGGDCAN